VLSELLQQADEPPEALSTLLDRLSTRPPATLREITDEQIALLRQHRMDDQIGLLRTGA
jgi:hypothetical protein